MEDHWILTLILHKDLPHNVIRNYWVFGLCPSSDILKKLENTAFRKLDLLSSSGQDWDTYCVGPIERAKRHSQFQFPKSCVLRFSECRTMDKVQETSNSHCYTPSSEPFRIYWHYYNTSEFFFREQGHEKAPIFLYPASWCCRLFQSIFYHNKIRTNTPQRCCQSLNLFIWCLFMIL
jgi:hypothetical protein